MQQQFGTPIKDVGLAGIQFSGPLVLAYRLERIAQLLLDIAQQVMEFGFVVMRQQGLRLAACTFVVARAFICERQVVGVLVIVGLEVAGALKVRDSLTCVATLRQ